MNTNDKGARTEGAVLGALVRAGYGVLIPFGILRYDLAIDAGDGEGVKRVQCKSGRLRYGGSVIVFPTSSSWPDGKRHFDYHGQADYFGVYCHETGDSYLVPVEETGAREAYLRLEPAKKFGGTSKIRMAADYLLRPSSNG